ncbi:mitochondrial distribution and morphology protein 34 [Kwoniella newhampshirensis]|uniref:Mitochondrial distribution and morphology protein 34 n=1 Tax=Kwoniella newhampshirensis TaxID=1651941 RepID=A0AAW0YX06_9TREE
MSFVFPSWSTAFSPAFHEDAKAMLEAALNKGNKPPVIQGRIEVVELSMGEQPPTLTLLEIGDLSLDRFRGILRLGYTGDAWLEVRCRVQANPLSHNPNLHPSSTLPLSTPLLASQPLLVPMTLRLSKLHLRAILILVVSASKGITLVFKNDPLQNVDVSSTFDSVEVIRGYLQQEIEGQLREMFREDLPGIIHRLSQRWFTGTGVGGKVETPYRDGGEYGARSLDEEDEEAEDDPYAEKEIFPPYVPTPSPSNNVNLTPRRQALAKAARSRRLSNAVSESPTSYTTFPDIEDYDPTYGLRPEGLPTHSGYEAFGRLWEKAREGGGRGLGSLMSVPREEPDEDRGDVSDGDWDEDDDDGNRSFDMVEMDESLRAIPQPLRYNSRRQSTMSLSGSGYGDEKVMEWETFPAVGGGVITRPRVYHSQSQIRAPSDAGGSQAMPSPAGTATGGSVTARASSVGGASSTIGSVKMRNYLPQTPGMNGSRRPGPSSLRRMVTSRSDVFLSSNIAQRHQPTRSESFAALPPPSSYSVYQQQRSALSRRLSNTAASSSAARTSGSSWETSDRPSRSATLSTLASSQLPSSKPMSITSKAQVAKIRNPSISGTSPGTSFPPRTMGPGGITLPMNNSVSQLATLSHSAHTLSPYARGHEHIAVRSFPYLGKGTGGGSTPSSHPGSSVGDSAARGDVKVKAKRKRIYRLGSKANTEAVNPASGLAKGAVAWQADRTPPSPQSSGVDTSSHGEEAWQSTHLISDQIGQANNRSPMRPNMVRAPDSRTSYGFPPPPSIRLG